VKRIAILGRGAHTLPTYRVLLNSLAAHYSITLYSEVPMTSDWLLLEHNYAIKSIPKGKYPRRLRDLLLLFLILRDHLKNPFALLHAHSTYPTGLVAILLKKVLKIPVVVALDAAEGSAFPAIDFGDLLSKRRAKLNQWVINQASFVTALTNFHRDQVYTNLKITKNISVIPRGVDPAKFSIVNTQKEKDSVTILSVSYLSPVKDPETLIRTFFLIQQSINCKLIHIGHDYMNHAIQQLVKEMGIEDKVFFMGHLTYEEIPEYYKKADLFLLTSVYESQALVVAEALAAGIPVAGTHVGLMADLSGKCCITVPPGNYKALAESVLALLRDKERMSTLRENGYNWSRQNNLDTCVATLHNIYDHLIVIKQ
jgi:glycosyltransferase involved in cell wall biosynthesis